MGNLSHQIIDFFNCPFFAILGGLSTLLVIAGILYRISCWSFCIVPIAIRFGIGMHKREIAIFADDKAFGDLEECLTDSKIFKKKNIVLIRNGSIERAKTRTVFLVDWESFGSNIEKVFSLRKNEQTPVVIYAKPGSIPQDQMSNIANRINVIVVNFKGRLLNDISTLLITTSYDGN